MQRKLMVLCPEQTALLLIPAQPQMPLRSQHKSCTGSHSPLPFEGLFLQLFLQLCLLALQQVHGRCHSRPLLRHRLCIEVPWPLCVSLQHLRHGRLQDEGCQRAGLLWRRCQHFWWYYCHRLLQPQAQVRTLLVR